MYLPRIVAAFVLAASVAGLAGGGAGAAEPRARPLPIERPGLLILIRGALTALDQANKTGNYTLLHDLGGPKFQENDATRLGELFAPIRQQQIDLSPVLVLEPVVTLGPQIEASGLMRLGGFFPTNPRQIDFEIAYQQVGPVWKLYGLTVRTSAPRPTPTTPRP